MRIRWCLTAMLLIGSSGCAGLKDKGIAYTPIPANADEQTVAKIEKSNADNDAAAKGIRYYGSSLYFIISTDGKGNVNWRLMELPDQTKKLTVQPYNGLAQVKVSLKFQNGILVGRGEQSDSSAFPKAVIDMLANVAPSIIKAIAASEGVQTLNGVRVYKVVGGGSHWEFNGTQGDNISVVLAPTGGK